MITCYCPSYIIKKVLDPFISRGNQENSRGKGKGGKWMGNRQTRKMLHKCINSPGEDGIY